MHTHFRQHAQRMDAEGRARSNRDGEKQRGIYSIVQVRREVSIHACLRGRPLLLLCIRAEGRGNKRCASDKKDPIQHHHKRKENAENRKKNQ